MPNCSLFFTRRCSQQQFLLRPDPKINEAVIYCVGVAAQKTGVMLTSMLVMANHPHTTVIDPEGRYPEFLRIFHSLLARCGNRIRRRRENFWAPEQPSVVLLADAAAHLDKIVYTLTNPLKANLVDKVLNWPGVCSLSYQLEDRPMVAKRPAAFFNPDGDMPEEVRVRFHRPPGFEHLTHEQWTELLGGDIRQREEMAAAERRRKGIRILGRRAVRKQSTTARPKTIAAKRRGIVPRVATRDKARRIAVLQRNRQFELRYRDALERRRQGDATTVFPYGTYQLQRLGLVVCEPRPPD